MRALGLSHAIAVVDWSAAGGAPRGSHRQAAARAQRFALLARESAAAGARTVLLAHHVGDNVETLLSVFARCSGLRGLRGIERSAAFGELRVVRPLLSVSKERLRATCVARGVEYVTDPSNFSPEYDRVRVRTAVARMSAGRGPSVEALVRVMAGARALVGDLDAEARALAATALTRHDICGFALLRPAALLPSAVPGVVARWLLRDILRYYGGQEFGASEGVVNRVYKAIALGSPSVGIALGGCVLRPHGAPLRNGALDASVLLLCREPGVVGAGARAPPTVLVPDVRVLWDRRFAITMRVDSGAPAPPPQLVVSAFSEPLRRALRASRHGCDMDARASMPHNVKVGLPAVCTGGPDGRLVALPHYGYCSLPGVRFETRFAPLFTMGARTHAQ